MSVSGGIINTTVLEVGYDGATGALIISGGTISASNNGRATLVVANTTGSTATIEISGDATIDVSGGTMTAKSITKNNNTNPALKISKTAKVTITGNVEVATTISGGNFTVGTDSNAATISGAVNWKAGSDGDGSIVVTNGGKITRLAKVRALQISSSVAVPSNLATVARLRTLK